MPAKQIQFAFLEDTAVAVFMLLWFYW